MQTIKQIFVLTFVSSAVFLFQNCGYVVDPDSHLTLSSEANLGSLQASVFSAKCTSCHSAVSPAGGYDLTNYAGIMSGGRVIPGNPGGSVLVQRIRDGSMPPGSPLNASEIKAIEDWITAGASATGGVEPANMLPVVDAGADQTVSLPMVSVSFLGLASDNDGTINSLLWEKVAGPNVIIGGTTTGTLTVSNLMAGTYTFKFTATDNDGDFSSDTVNLVVLGAPNVAPTANAGSDKAITLPVSSVAMVGSGSDSDGTITTYAWTKVSGGAATLSGANTATLTASDLLVGTYVFRLTVTDNSGVTASDDVVVMVSAANMAPVVNAGADTSITQPANSVSLVGTATDSDGTIATRTWSQVSGPSTAVIASPTQLTTQIQSLMAGVYVFQLRAVDNGGLAAVDTVSVTVVAAANVLPVANAGSDRTITLPTNSVVITGTGTDSDGTIASYAWTKVSGGAATLSGANTASLTASGLVAGSYVFRLTVRDNSNATATDDVTVSVNAANNVAPVANAGADKTVASPATSVSVTGTATDSDGTIASTAWSQVSGPSTATIATPAALTTQIQALVGGSYVFQFRAVDNGGSSSVDTVTVTVTNALPTANAGADRAITLPTNSVTIAGSGADSDGTITSYAWTKFSGGAATLGGASTANLTASGLVAGTYVFRLTVRDSSNATATDDVIVTVSAANVAPTVNAGADKVITAPASSVSATGTASDSDGSIASTAWSQVSGPSTATISSPSALTTNIQALAVGTYVFQLRATDNGGLASNDTVTVTVSPAANVAPTANAGADKAITLPTSSTSFTGSGTDSDGTIASYAWRQVSGPSTATLAGATTATVTASALVAGTYVFELRVTDNSGGSAVDTAAVVVSAGANPNATFTWIYANVLQNRCQSCHGANGDAGIDVRTHASTLKMVRPGSATGSAFYTEVNSGSMPRGSSKLSADQINAIRDWINAGALNN